MATDLFAAAVAHHLAGRLDEAVAGYGRTLVLKPDYAEAHSNLGFALQTLGRIAEAEASCRRALVLRPDYVEAHSNLGNALHGLGRLEEAEASYRRALALKPGHVEALGNLGVVLRDLGRLVDAEASLRRALALKPDYAEAHNTLGVTLKGLGRSEDALASLRRAVALRPEYAEAQGNLAAMLADQGRLDDAEAGYRRVLALRPDHAEAHNNLGVILKDLGRPEEAVASLRRAVALKPDYAEAHGNLAVALVDLGRLDEAEATYRRALAINPEYAEAHSNLGNALFAQGRIDEAITHLEQAVEGRPDLADAHRNLLSMLLYHPSLDQETIFAAHRRFETLHARPHYPSIQPHRNGRDPKRRLRIGYLSADFRAHSVARNLLPILRNHDRARFELYCYAEVFRPDDVTAAFQSLADRWRVTVGQSDQQVAAQIREDGIDILVCLAARFEKNRPLVCAWRPAPIQISYHDVATSGLEVMDYIISDRVLTPRNSSERFAERPLCLPGFYIGEIPPGIPPVRRRNGPIVFGCLNNPAKITVNVISLWANILNDNPNSTLLLKYRNWYDGTALRDRVIAEFARSGIDASRLNFSSAVDILDKHLDIYNEIDIALDPFPFSGSTTTFEALIMGVPVITMPGENMVSRWTAAMLTSLGLTDLIADTPWDYLDRAGRLAEDADRRSDLRITLRNRVARSSLCDHVGKTRHIERLYRATWRRWCAESR
ncbi:MAG: tetratricopeptide repeat protein [Alphaproteobacteria bacterium]